MESRKVCVGHPLHFYSNEDRWGRPVRTLDAPSYGTLDADLWFNVRRFQEHEPSGAATALAHKQQMQPMLIELQDAFRLNPQRTVIWQLCLDKGRHDFVRVCTTFMAGAQLIEYRWYHRVAAKALELGAWIYNKTVARFFPIRYDAENEPC
jgi:hypothetical protein